MVMVITVSLVIQHVKLTLVVSALTIRLAVYTLLTYQPPLVMLVNAIQLWVTSTNSTLGN